MKKNLGRVFIIVLFFSTILEASTYKWSAKANKNNIVTNEAIHLTYECVFSDQSELYVIEFNPVIDNQNYTIKLLSEKERIEDGHRINSFEFVLFIKNEGAFDLALDALVKKTNRDSIENTVLGRDNRSYEEYSITKVSLPTLAFEVKNVKEQLVGTLNLNAKYDEQNITQYAPYHLELSIEGEGDFNLIEPFTFAIEGVKVFAEKPIWDYTLEENGYKGVWKQKFAFVSEGDFTIPAKSLHYFNLQERADATLNTPQLHIHVKQSSFKKETLLDEVSQKRFVWKNEYWYYALTFLSGFLVAKIRFKKRVKRDHGDKALCEKIDKARGVEQVGILLIMEDAVKYKTVIEKIENKELTTPAQVKRLICR